MTYQRQYSLSVKGTIRVICCSCRSQSNERLRVLRLVFPLQYNLYFTWEYPENVHPRVAATLLFSLSMPMNVNTCY